MTTSEPAPTAHDLSSTGYNDPVPSLFPGTDADLFGWSTPNGCGCSTCIGELLATRPFPANLSWPFIVCPDCGNKRCPKATHHDNTCTASNDVGQPGSRYRRLPVPDPTDESQP